MRRRRWAWALLGALVLGGVVVASRFEEWAVHAIVDASAPEYSLARVPDGAYAVEVERDDVQIRAWVIDPERPPRATVLILHGIHDSKASQLPTARRLAARGYRSIAVDLRGHGESTGRFLTYGVEDAPDLSALIDQLETEHLVAGPLGVLGTSYGAATAIQLGGRDARVRTVVAISPFASLREVVPEYAQLMLGPIASMLPDAYVASVIDEAGRRARFDPDAACPRCVASSINGPLFLIHGREDRRIPWSHSQRIRDAAGRVELWVVEGAGHGVAGAAGVSEAVDAWLDTHLHG